MRYLITLFFALLLCACDQKKAEMEKRLRDTLEILRIKTDFKPLPENEAYVFLNKYYLPRLDTLDIHRKIFIHPLNGTDFKRLFKTDSIALVAKYTVNSTIAHSPQYILVPSEDVTYNYHITWRMDRFKNVVPITDSLDIAIHKNYYGSLDRLKKFKELFGAGYMMIAYPQYNQRTNLLIIKEWLVDGGWCGTGKDGYLHTKRLAMAGSVNE